jgi:NAD(P)-dependent dehydrogenase (short-subunit alcohol dehydrogenase family)
MEINLKGRAALITGGSKGLGLAMATRFAESGADVAILARGRETLDQAKAQISAVARGKVAAFVCDVAKAEDISRAHAAVIKDLGRIDILVNNAGMSPAVPSHEVTEQLFDSVVGLNFKGPFRLASQVAHRMNEGDGGVIINVSSSGALVPLPAVVPYSGAKAALNAMTVSLAREYGPKVRVNTLSAGPFLTDISKAWTPEARERADNSLGRPGRPEEVVTTALYLASPMSSFTTGAIVRVDGGMG